MGHIRTLVVVAGLGLLVVAGVLPAHADRGPASDALNGACQPDPLDPGVQILSCRYGPITVTPGSNLILFGPVTVESPRADGFMTAFRPDMVDAVTGEVPPIHEVHLHHGVWLNPRAAADLTPFAASGEEKTVTQIPDGYGYRTRPTDEWVLNYMVHNLTSSTYEVAITYEVTWVPYATALADGMRAVEPIWLDVVGGAYPVYDPERPDDPALPPEHARAEDFGTAKDYEIVWMAGHVHPGGLRDEVRVETCNGQPAFGSPEIFTSEAVPNERNGDVPDGSFGSWDFLMTATPPGWSFTLRAGDRLSLTSVYDTTHPWYEAMGIVFGWANPLEPGEAPTRPLCELPLATTGTTTRAVPTAEPVFGGDDVASADPTSLSTSGPAVSTITIRGFDYSPGGLGQAPAPVAAGSTVRFQNADAAASIFHTFTPCGAPCNGNWGQSYPLPLWDLPDSGQLGYGPRYGSGDDQRLSAAANRHTFDLQIPGTAVPGDTITYFCRVHPFMRGSLRVV